MNQLFLKNSISYGSQNHSDTRKILGDGSSSLDLGAEKCDWTCVFAVDSHFLLRYDFSILIFHFDAYRYEFVLAQEAEHDYHFWEIEASCIFVILGG